MLSKEQVQRYSRHLIIPEVGVEGQKKLLGGRVLLIGAGGLGSPLSLYLAAAGVGTLGIIDFDAVDFSNLQRQVIYTTEDVGRKKVAVAAERIHKLNAEIEVETYEERLSSGNALEIFSRYDVIVDGTDNFPTRYLTNDACVLTGKPNVHGSIFRFEGQATVFWPGKGPCYRCLYPEPPPPGMVPSCAEGGVLGILPGLVGLIQATETVKILLGRGEPLVGRLLLFDAMKMEFRELKLQRDPSCPACSENATIKELIDYEAFCGIRGQETPGAVDEDDDKKFGLDPEKAREILSSNGQTVLLDVREPFEYEIVNIPNSRLIPLNELPQRVHELDTADDIIVYCHRGVRSLKACKILEGFGFRKLKSIRGGVDAWAEKVDPSLPRY